VGVYATVLYVTLCCDTTMQESDEDSDAEADGRRDDSDYSEIESGMHQRLAAVRFFNVMRMCVPVVNYITVIP
jgi:hypothetical protein